MLTSEHKPGTEWRLVRTTHESDGFVKAACKPVTLGADAAFYLRNMNRPQLVGVVDPADVSHLPFEDFAPRCTLFVDDVMGDSLRGTTSASASEQQHLLDNSEEHRRADATSKAFLAAQNTNMELLEEQLQALIVHGGTVDERDENGNSLLIVAAQQGSMRFVKFLLRRHADFNIQNLHGNTALHYCFQYSFNKLAEYLIAKGANDAILNKDGLTCYEGLNADLVEAI